MVKYKMNKLITCFVSILLLFSSHLAMSCDYPQRVLIPNGNTATQEEMLEGQREVKRYIEEMDSYLECMETEESQSRESINDLDPEEEQEREVVFNKKYNAAVDEMERLAAQFNAEIQAYKAQQ